MRAGLGELAEFYREEWTLRQVFIRIRALPDDAPLWFEMRAEEKKSEQADRDSQAEDAVARFRR